MIQRRAEDWNTLRNIGVTGSGPGCGATTLAAALACYFGRQNHTVCYTECKSHTVTGTLFFDSIDMERRFQKAPFISVYDLIRRDKPLRKVSNIWQNVNWRLYTPGDKKYEAELTDEEKWKLIGSATGEICIFDFDSNGSWDGFFKNMDMLIIVIDPLPSRLIRDRNRIQSIEPLDSDNGTLYRVINHMNPGVSKRQVKRFFSGENLVFLEHIPTAQVYASEFRCRPLWSSTEGQRVYDNAIREILGK